MNAIAKNIKKFRNAKDISQEELANKIKVTRQAVSNWETGKTQPDLDMISSISEALEVDMTELIYGQKRTNEYEINKKDRIKRAIMITVSFVVLMLIFEFGVVYFNKMRGDTFFFLWYFFFAILLLPALYALASSVFLSILSIWNDITIKKIRARKILLFCGAAIVWLYFLTISLNSLFYDLVSHGGIMILYHLNRFFASFPSFFIVPGLLVFLGLNGSKAELKKSIIIVSVITACLILMYIIIDVGHYIGSIF